MDLIFFGGNIHTMDKEKPIAQAIAVRNGLIEAVGGEEEILKLKTENTELINLEGKTLIPGFNDSHMHLLGYAGEMNSVDLSGVLSVDEIIERIKNFISLHNIPKGQTVRGSGWNQNFFEKKVFPTRYDLDRASTEHFIEIERACRHVSVVNSICLEKAGVDESTPDSADGEILRDSNGVPTGVFTENARAILKREAKVLAVSDIENLILRAAPNLAKMGITSVQTDDFGGNNYHLVHEAYTNLAKAGKLTFRANQQCRASGFENYKNMMSLAQSEENIRNFYKLGPVKIMADGSLGARTAFMLEDYKDAEGTRGIPIYSQDELEKIVTLAHENNRQVAVHAIGDGAMDMALTAIEKAQNESPKADMRHGIVHCQITDERMLERFAENEIIAYIQPIFIYADHGIVESRVGKEKAATSYAFKTLKNKGVKTPFGTDCPVEKFNPFENIYCAVTRKDFDGNPQGGFNPKEALTPHEALFSYTAEPAYASFEDEKKGMIKEGMFADLAVLDKDILNCSAEEILETTVEMTVFDGKIIFVK